MVAFGCVVSRSVEGALRLHTSCGVGSRSFGFVGGVSIVTLYVVVGIWLFQPNKVTCSKQLPASERRHAKKTTTTDSQNAEANL